jgi:hypothetical protein
VVEVTISWDFLGFSCAYLDIGEIMVLKNHCCNKWITRIAMIRVEN